MQYWAELANRPNAGEFRAAQSFTVLYAVGAMRMPGIERRHCSLQEPFLISCWLGVGLCSCLKLLVRGHVPCKGVCVTCTL